jgi:hypothetical protein
MDILKWILLLILTATIISGCSPEIELGFWDGNKKYGKWQCVENSEPYRNKNCEETKK